MFIEKQYKRRNETVIHKFYETACSKVIKKFKAVLLHTLTNYIEFKTYFVSPYNHTAFQCVWSPSK